MENTTALIWKLLLVAEGTFRRLNAPELLVDVATGIRYVDGVAVNQRNSERVAA